MIKTHEKTCIDLTDKTIIKSPLILISVIKSSFFKAIVMLIELFDCDWAEAVLETVYRRGKLMNCSYPG